MVATSPPFLPPYAAVNHQRIYNVDRLTASKIAKSIKRPPENRQGKYIFLILLEEREMHP